MASIAVVAVNHMRSAFSDYMKLRRQNIGKGIPSIGVKSTVFKVCYLVVTSFEYCAVTTTENPGDSSPAAAVRPAPFPAHSGETAPAKKTVEKGLDRSPLPK
jgi:hypothetical protein